MKQYKWYQISLIAFVSVVINVCGRILMEHFRFPIWFDSFGTFLTAYTLGPVCGVMVGISGNIIHGMFNPVLFVYSISSIVIALMVGYLAKKGWMKTYLKTMSLSVLVTVVCAFISCVLDIFFSEGKIGNIWGQGVSDFLETLGVPFFFRVLIGQFYVDFLDKVITLSLLYFFLKFIHFIKPYSPSFFLPSEDFANNHDNNPDENPVENSAENSIANTSENHDENSDIEKTNVKSLLLFLLIFAGSALGLCEKSYALNKDYNSYVRFIYNKENGLPSGKTNDIASSRDGIIWIGTYEGLYRYNGNEFYLMNSIKSIKTVRCLYVDNENRLFVGTNDEGLSILINENVANVIDEDDGLPNNSVRCITRGSNSLYYVGTSGQMAILSITDGLSIKKVLPQIEGAISISSDNYGNVATVTYDGALYILHDTEIVEKDDSQKFTSVTFSDDGVLYASTENNEIKVFSIQYDDTEDGDSGIFLKKKKIFLQQETNLRCKNLRHINSLNFYENVLFVCADNGIGFFEDDKFVGIESGSFNNSVDHMMADYQGNLWFTSSRLGLLKMCKSPFSEVYLSAGFSEVVVNSITSFNNHLYFATDNGLTAINESTGKAVTNELTQLLKNVRVRCLLTTKDNSMWICTKSKGAIFVDSQGNISQFVENHQCRVACELNDGTIAIGANDGIVFIKDEKIINWITVDDGLEFPMILTISQTEDDVVFAGTDGSGLGIIQFEDNEWKLQRLLKRKDGLGSNVILRTVNDYYAPYDKPSFFAVTSNGICYIQKESDSYNCRYLSNFPYTNNYDLVIAPEKNVFVLSSAGIFEVNRDELLSGEKLEYQLLDLKKGLRGSLTSNSWNYLDKDMNLYLSCDSGASCINLNTFDKIDNSYRIQLNSILIDEARYYLQKDYPIVIPPESERIEICPEVINYSINNPLVSFFLEGVDEKPIVVPQKSMQSVVYNHLKAGTYNFYIQILDSKGINVKEESVFVIQKKAHIYDNWWFMLYLFAVAMIAIAWLTWFITFTIQSKRIEVQRKEVEAFKYQVRMGNETIFAIANSVEARDKSTGRHSLRVADYAVLIAKELGFSDSELENLHKIGLLHDIGKIGVPDSILNKPSRLTEEEYIIMKTHVNIGAEILKDFTLVPHVVDGAKYHHERYDGKGYPNGLKGEEIPLNARIIGIADAFDAMTANRVYRTAQNMDYVIEELHRCKGTQFDPCLVEIMLELIENGKLCPKN